MPHRTAQPAGNASSSGLRAIRQEDNAALAAIIRGVLTEFGCVEEGFAIHDPEVDQMFESYAHARSRYFVVECDGRVVGGGGIAPLRGTYQNIAELQKFYILKDYRGRGFGRQLLKQCMDFVSEHHFQRCYIETIEKMNTAEALYKKEGFERIEVPLGNTGHHACDRWYVKIM